MSSPSPSRPVVSPALNAVCAGLALVVPLAITAERAGVTPQWRDDLAVVTSLGFVPLGGEGVPSALAAELLSLLPIGGRVFRAALTGTLACALASASAYAIALRLLGAAARTPRLAPLLALAAALTTTLSFTWQHEGTAAGGSAFAAALALFALRDEVRLADVRAAALQGALFGLVLAERRAAGALLFLALLVEMIVHGTAPRRRTLVAWFVAAAATWGFCLLPLFVRPLAEQAWIHFGVDLSSRAALAADAVLSRRSPLALYATEMGPVALGLALAGLVRGLVSRPLRAATLALAVLVAVTAMVPVRGPSALAEDPLAVLDLLAISGLAVLAVVGVQALVVLLLGLRVPFAEPAGVLLVVFHFTLVFVAAEQTSEVVTPTTGLGADVWTDEALSELPPNSLLLVRSPVLTFRLWAARVARGERPDLVVVPLGLIGRGSVARRLVEEEPALGPLVRDVAMTGRTSEYALASLADARPLYVELDPSWDDRLLSHLRPTPLWLGFVPHTLGRSDRTRSVAEEGGRRAFQRVLGVARAVPGGDSATLAVLGARAREQAVVLAALGDRESAQHILSDLRRIDPSSTFTPRLEERLSGKARIFPREFLE